MRAITKPIYVLLLALSLAPQAQAQRDKKFLRTNPKFIETFREVVAKPSVSTVRIICDGKDTALGMIVAADGWVLTKANDLKMPIECRLKDGREFAAAVVGVHKGHDLAMLKIDAKNLVPVVLTPSQSVGAGSWVACAGINEDPVAVGVVSVSTRTLLNKGPALDNSKSGLLGVYLDEGEAGEVIITSIEPNSAASEAGLKAQDIILALGQKSIKKVEVFMEEMAKTRPGDVVTLKISRDDEELNIKATLRKRSLSPSRGDFQNKMGSELSSRRSGYGTILQHDSVVKPADCGGPIVDLDGRVIGINICRAGRTESWAVPSEVLQTVLADLKSGKLAPPEDFARASTSEKTAAIDGLLNVMKQRLEAAADLARYRVVNKIPKGESNKDAGQLAILVLAAEGTGLDQKMVREFFTAQFAASRQLREELLARWHKDEKSLSAERLPTFEITLRRKLERLSLDLFSALARAEPYLRETSGKHLLRDRSAQVLHSEAISEAVRDKALEGWLVRK